MPANIPGADRVTIIHLVAMTAGYVDVEALPDIQQAFLEPKVTIAAVVKAVNEGDLGQCAILPGLVDSDIAAAAPPPPNTVSLPGTVALLGLGLAALASLRRVPRAR